MTIALLATGCSSSSSNAFAVTAASVDASYLCPSGSSNSSYDVHATVHVHNPTSSAVAIESVAAEMTLVAVKGGWLEKVGDKYDPAKVSFTPYSAPAGGDTTLDVTIGSSCTNGKGGATSYGDYRLALTVTTSSGTYSVTARNNHRIATA